MLNPDSPLPLYQQLADELRTRIRAGQFEAGERIPSEHELAARYGLGRPTVRQATEVLVRGRLLERRRGAGTFVRESATEVDLFSLGGTLDSFRRSGVSLETEILKPLRLRGVAMDDENPFSGTRAYSFERLGSVKGSAVLLERIWLGAELFAGIDRHMQQDGSLSRIVEERYRLKPRAGQQTFRVHGAGDDTAKALAVEPGTPLLLVKRTLDFPQATAAIFAEIYCRTDGFVFAQTIGEIENA